MRNRWINANRYLARDFEPKMFSWTFTEFIHHHLNLFTYRKNKGYVVLTVEIVLSFQETRQNQKLVRYVERADQSFCANLESLRDNESPRHEILPSIFLVGYHKH
jgi:hypothetical protein